MLAKKRRGAALSLLLSLVMVLSIGIPSSVYGADSQSDVHAETSASAVAPSVSETSASAVAPSVSETSASAVAPSVSETSASAYDVWKENPPIKSKAAKFYIRLNGSVPIEDGSTQYAHGDYTTGKLSGEVDGIACWTDFSGVIDKQTGRINGTKIEEAFASVRPHIIAPPSNEEVERMLKKDGGAKKRNLTFDPNTQRIIWYVVKKVPGEGKEAWHVDGVICSKDVLEMLQYHGNAGSDNTVKGIPSMQMHKKGDAAVPIIFDGITRKGYEFCGWSEDPNATPQNLEYPKDGTNRTIPMDGEKHLYAVWKAKPSPKPEAAWRIIYDANEPSDASVVSGMPDDGKDKRNGVYELSTQKPNCSEGVDCTYEFKGWSLQDGKDGEEQASETSVTITDGDVTVYAIWQPIPKKKCTVTIHYYKWNENPNHLYGREDQLAEPVIAVKDEIGKRYTVNDEDTSQKVIAGYEYYQTDGNVKGTLTRDEEINVLYKETLSPAPERTYTINYDGNVPEGVSVSGLPGADTQLKQGLQLLSSELPTRPAEDSCTWECKGWSLLTNGDPQKDRIQQVEIKDGDVTVYAIWVRIPKDASSGGGDQGGSTDPIAPSGGGTNDKDPGGRDHNGNGTVIISDSEVPLAPQPTNPPEVMIPDQAIPLASNPQEQPVAEERGVPLSGISKLPKTGGIGGGFVIGMGALLIAVGLLFKRKVN